MAKTLHDCSPLTRKIAEKLSKQEFGWCIGSSMFAGPRQRAALIVTISSRVRLTLEEVNGGGLIEVAISDGTVTSGPLFSSSDADRIMAYVAGASDMEKRL